MMMKMRCPNRAIVIGVDAVAVSDVEDTDKRIGEGDHYHTRNGLGI